MLTPPVQFAEDLWVRKSCSAAGHTVLVFDYFLTLNDEILYIWNAPWTWVKIMFLINRYGNLLGQTFIRLEEAGILTNNSTDFCRKFIIITAAFMLTSSEMIHILVILRAWAIWGTKRRTAKFLIWSYVIYFIVQMLGVMWGTVGGHEIHFSYLKFAEVCSGRMPNYAWLSYLGSFLIDTLLFSLTMRSLWKYSREFQYLYPSGLLYVLVRDAIIFFTVSMFSDGVTNATWTALQDNPKYFIGKGFATPLLSVAGQRLVLNLRGLKTRTYETHDLSREVDRQLAGFADADDPISMDDLNLKEPPSRLSIMLLPYD